MEPDDLLCSHNARSRTPLVGRAQWKINQPPSLKEYRASLDGVVQGRAVFFPPGACALGRMEGSGQVPFLLAERARSECARSMRAVKGSLGHSLLERNERAWEDLFVASLDGRSQKLHTLLRRWDLVGEMRREKTPAPFHIFLRLRRGACSTTPGPGETTMLT